VSFNARPSVPSYGHASPRQMTLVRTCFSVDDTVSRAGLGGQDTPRAACLRRYHDPAASGLGLGVSAHSKRPRCLVPSQDLEQRNASRGFFSIPPWILPPLEQDESGDDCNGGRIFEWLLGESHSTIDVEING
jgi:hypothetical protein